MLAAKISTQWNSREKTLFLALTWHDTGIEGKPMIEIDEKGDAIVSIRHPVKELSILEQAAVITKQLVGAASTELCDIDFGAGNSVEEY